MPSPQVNPCQPSPCGPNSLCKEIGDTPSCSCMPEFTGSPPYCRPECISNSECSNHLACVNQKCKNPCENMCGTNAECRVVSHTPMCTCSNGFVGDPFIQCNIPIAEIAQERPTPCTPSPCGTNAICKEQNGAGSCTCIPDYFGNPYEGCRPECILNSDCPSSRACIRNKCQDPCPGSCGPNADCQVVNHLPSCTCRLGFTGDPFRYCNAQIEPLKEEPTNPCQPTPCGPNSQCREVNGQAVCSCLPNYVGSPPGCRPECVVSSECPTHEACIGQKCVNPCPGPCAQNTDCKVVNHSPICSCRFKYTGDPFSRCYPIPAPISPVYEEPTRDPCIPSPCGAHSQCRNIGGNPSCTCLSTYIGSPPNCRPECSINPECSSNKACIREKCIDPCPGSCGLNAQCRVINHTPTCSCLDGYTGDPFTNCNLKPIMEEPQLIDPCNPSPCGANAECNQGTCTCLAEYQGDPYFGCRPECVLSQDCVKEKACVRKKCVDPCPGTCGRNAVCEVINHIPMCSCSPGTTGNAFVDCRPVTVVEVNPCNPSPCGPNSQCRQINGQGVCSCIVGYIGAPPTCRPECIISSECPLNEACSNQKCINPCSGTCGINARCEVVNHNPICTCPPRHTGDPFTRCIIIADTPPPQVNPCLPSPCGPYSLCREVGESPSCSCLANYVGAPPNCKPECISNSECQSNTACINQKCKDPCPGSCGANAECRVVSHTPMCVCLSGYIGDPFVQCNIQQHTPAERPTPCTPSPCGANALCKELNGAGSCACIPDYLGNPYEGCRPECVLSSDCPSNRACIRNKCQDPCPGTCAPNADCQVINHHPSCTCRSGYTGDPFRFCTVEPEPVELEQKNVCQPSPCGPNSQCKQINGQAVCSCLSDYIGTPPGCRPECSVSSECDGQKACFNHHCINPCPGPCGLNSDCKVINHSPICSCKQRYTGDPFSRCYPIPEKPQEIEPILNRDPCVPSPCGPNAECRNIRDTASCSCLSTFIGNPPNCRPECTINPECPSDKACMNRKCRDPCPGSCGLNAECSVRNHVSVCTCIEGYTGDPFTSCIPKPQQTELQINNPCEPSPCGSNAQCDDGICTCLPEYHGDPYFGCRPECVLATDCSTDKTCLRKKCVDPCPGTCAQNALCNVINHVPMCSCPQGFIGNAFLDCRSEPVSEVSRPCEPSPCGPNSQCREINSQAVCSCLPNYIGSPPTCRPECVVSSECQLKQACSNQKCINPCAGTCGVGAKCEVVNHNPICVCPQRFSGDPFVRCSIIVETPTLPLHPCQPSPCGPNSECKEINETPSCSCLGGFIYGGSYKYEYNLAIKITNLANDAKQKTVARNSSFHK